MAGVALVKRSMIRVFLFHFNIMRNNFASKWKQQWYPKRRHYMGRSEVSTSVVKWSEGVCH